eukprot:gene26933-4555_t
MGQGKERGPMSTVINSQILASMPAAQMSTLALFRAAKLDIRKYASGAHANTGTVQGRQAWRIMPLYHSSKQHLAQPQPSTVVQDVGRFGGNPFYSAGGRAVLRVLDKEKRQEHCAKKLQEKHDLIVDVRGQGLMLVVELVKYHKTKEPAKAELPPMSDFLVDVMDEALTGL